VCVCVCDIYSTYKPFYFVAKQWQ